MPAKQGYATDDGLIIAIPDQIFPPSGKNRTQDGEYDNHGLEHQFWTAWTPAMGFWAQSVYTNVYTLPTFEKRLERTAFPENEADLNGHDPMSMILGDGWESLNELILNYFGTHPDIGVSNHRVLPPGTTGCDFAGIGKNGKPATVQSKYKGSGHAWEIELSEGPEMPLERFRLQSIDVFNVDPADTHNMLVITNAQDIHYRTKDHLLNKKVRCLGRQQIRYLVDNNRLFWDSARQAITKHNENIKFK